MTNTKGERKLFGGKFEKGCLLGYDADYDSREDGREKKKKGRIHGNPVADGWAGAVGQKPLGIQKGYGGTNQPTD